MKGDYLENWDEYYRTNVETQVREDHYDLMDSDTKKDFIPAVDDGDKNVQWSSEEYQKAKDATAEPSAEPSPEIPGHMCMKCAGKHLAKAEVALLEWLSGAWMDAKHEMRIMGNLGEAEDHLGSWSELAKRMRDLRLEVEGLFLGGPVRDPAEIDRDFIRLYEDIKELAKE